MNKINNVRIADKTIYINGVAYGYIEGTRSEVWISGHPNGTAAGERGQFVARIKYFKPGSRARKFIKAVFSRVSMKEYLDLLADHRAPMDVARLVGGEGELA